MKTILKTSYVNDTALDVLRRDGIYICADCGGKGHCGKCKVRFTDPAEAPRPNECDRKFFSDEELLAGWRLACTAVLSEGRELKAPSLGASFEVEIPDGILIHDYTDEAVPPGDQLEAPSASEIIACDYGIMTISGALVDLNKGVIKETEIPSHLRAYGRNIRPRIKSSAGGCSEEMRKVAERDLAELSARLGRDPEKCRYIISAGTATQHIISGFSCKGLLKKPYEPLDTSLRRDGNLTMLPCAGMAGSRLISGLAASNMDMSDKPFLYIDIDATIEMALGNGKDLFVSATKWGPRDMDPGISWKKKDVERIKDDIMSFITRTGVDPFFMDNVILSGDLDGMMSFDDVVSTGLLPGGLESKVSSAGNASLSGAVLYALDTGFGKRLTMLASRARYIEI